MKKSQSINPWGWIPTLYFAEGIPYFIVNTISVIMFTNMGMSNGDMAMYTSLLYLPWVVKPLWSPFVDIIRTKRWWVIAMQIIMSAAFALLAFSLPHPSSEVIAEGVTSVSLFKLTLVLFWITAFAEFDYIASRMAVKSLDTSNKKITVIDNPADKDNLNEVVDACWNNRKIVAQDLEKRNLAIMELIHKNFDLLRDI